MSNEKDSNSPVDFRSLVSGITKVALANDGKLPAAGFVAAMLGLLLVFSSTHLVPSGMQPFVHALFLMPSAFGTAAIIWWLGRILFRDRE